MANSLVDEVERLGCLVEQREMDRDTAAHQLAQFSDGGLTLAGARSLIANWSSARDQYEKGMALARTVAAS